MGARTSVASVVLCVGIAVLSASETWGQKVLNPKGQEASALVVEMMKRYGIEQGKLEFIDAGTWVYASETSAVVALETNLRAKSVLEYGPTAEYGSRLTDDELHYIHIYHLRDLKPDTTYHFRLSAEDRNGSKAVGRDQTLQTKSMRDVVRIPDDMEGPPYQLNKAGTTYLVTKDITAPGTAFNISAGDVTLDLGGRTIVYNEEHMGLPTDSFNNQIRDSAFGVRVRGAGANVKILNGTIRQGKGNDEASYTTIGFNPIYLTGAAGSEIAGVNCIYTGRQLTGIVCHWSGDNIRIHHNVVDDRGNLIANRHQSCSAIKPGSKLGSHIYNNLVKRARQCALGSVGEKAQVYSNELHIDSYGINGFGIGVKHDSVVRNNRIFGCGDNVVALGTTGGCRNVKLHDNYIWLHAHDIKDYQQDLNKKAMESSEYSIMSGVRITWGSESVDYSNNVILVTARDGGKVRGTFLYADANSKGAVFRDSLVIAICENDRSDGWGAIGGVGVASRGAPVPIQFRNNTIVSNFANFSMKDSYGTSNNYHFVGNTFVKVGDRADYATIKSRAGYASQGHIFLDSTFEGGAGFDRVSGMNQETFEVQWTLTLSAPAGARVTIADKDGKQVFDGTVGADGKLSVPLAQQRLERGQMLPATPHTVTVEARGRVAVEKVTMDAPKTLKVE